MCGKTRFGEQFNADKKIVNMRSGDVSRNVMQSEKQARRESLRDPNSYWAQNFNLKEEIYGLQATHFMEGNKWFEVPENHVIVGLMDPGEGFIPITTQTTPDETLTYLHYRKPLMVPINFYKEDLNLDCFTTTGS